MYIVDFSNFSYLVRFRLRMDHAYFPVKGHKISNPGQIQDTVKSRSRPCNRGLSWKIQDGWSPLRTVSAVSDSVPRQICVIGPYKIKHNKLTDLEPRTLKEANIWTEPQ